MLTLSENPTSKDIIAIIEIYIQMNRIISSISILENAYDTGITVGELAKYRQSIDPTLFFLLQVQENEKYISDNNSFKRGQRKYNEIHESILSNTAIWLKQHLTILS